MAAEIPSRPSGTFQSVLLTILTAFKSAFECHATTLEHRAAFTWSPADVSRLASEFVSVFGRIASLTDAQVSELLLSDADTDRFSIFGRIKFSAKFASCSPEVRGRIVVRMRELLANADCAVRVEPVLQASMGTTLDSLAPMMESARAAVTSMSPDSLEAASRQLASADGPFRFVMDMAGTMFPGAKRPDGTLDMVGLVNQLNTHITAMLAPASAASPATP